MLTIWTRFAWYRRLEDWVERRANQVCVQCNCRVTGEWPTLRGGYYGGVSCHPPRSSQVFTKHRRPTDPHPFATGQRIPPPPPPHAHPDRESRGR